MLKVLLIGKYSTAISGVKAHLDQRSVDLEQAVSTDSALQTLQAKKFHVVVLSGAVTIDSRNEIEALISRKSPGTRLILALRAADAIKMLDAMIARHSEPPTGQK